MQVIYFYAMSKQKFTNQAELVSQTLQITICLGKTITQRMAAVQAIKDAMSAAIMLTVEVNEQSLDTKNVEVYTQLYREANTIEHYLKLL